jgi:hypothetical protein
MERYGQSRRQSREWKPKEQWRMDSPETLATCRRIHVQYITFIFRNKEPHFTVYD